MVKLVFLFWLWKSTYESQVKFSSLGKFREDLEFFGAGFHWGAPFTWRKIVPSFHPPNQVNFIKK